jgi:PAS domain S-box-containing protein
MTQGFLQKLLARLDRLAPEEIHNQVLRLVQEKGFFEQVFQSLQEGVIICEPQGQITFINKAACRFFGAEMESAIGKSVEEIIRGLDWALLTNARRASVSRDLEIVYPERRWLNFYLSPIEDAEAAKGSARQNKPLGYVLLLRDQTQNIQRTEEMLESERLGALTVLAAGVAHEIGNPLNSLNIHLQLLERKLKKQDANIFKKVQSELAVAQGEVKRLHFIIEQFLGAMRPSKTNFELTALNPIVEEAVNFLAPEIQDRGIQVRLKLTEGLPMLRLDASQMKQACYNLIKNACQAMGSGGKLEIRTTLDDYTVRLTFADTGAGISPDDLGQVFEPFFTTKQQGTGLGMLIVRRIVQQHGGEVAIESEVGRGTTVTLHLPRGAKNTRVLGHGESDERAPEVIDV